MPSSVRVNPYDFLNPVDDPTLFAGRRDELKTLLYYLERAKHVETPMHVAVVGPRASGKTSILNMAEFHARRLEYCPVRVSLDEGDTTGPLAFFHKLIDSLMLEAVTSGAFGGPDGMTYDAYRQISFTFQIPDDKTFCPLLFPLQYASMMLNGDVTAPVSENQFLHDVRVIQQELASTVVFILDECDALKSSPVLLQKFRSVMQRSKRVMYIFAGTQAMFPVMDDVFSPISRQFKMISIGPFTDPRDTLDCIRRPLAAAGYSNPEQLHSLDLHGDVQDLHSLAGGNPYEIQMLLHYLYRHVEEGKATRLELSVDVLDAVLDELDSRQATQTRSLIRYMRSWSPNQFRSLGLLCTSNGYETLDQIIFRLYVTIGLSDSQVRALTSDLETFVDHGVIVTSNDIVTFAGDHFDRIYSKYLAKKHGVEVFVTDWPPQITYVVPMLSKLVSTGIYDGHVPKLFSSDEQDNDIARTIETVLSNGALGDVFSDNERVAVAVYWANWAYRGFGEFGHIEVELRTPWLDSVHLQLVGTKIPETQDPNDSPTQMFSEIASRAHDKGGSLDVTTRVFNTVSHSRLVDLLRQSDNEAIRTQISDTHLSDAVDTYLELGLVDEAIEEALVAWELNQTFHTCNNLGYLVLRKSQDPKALSLFHEARHCTGDLSLQLLAAYNVVLAELAAGCGDLSLGDVRMLQAQAMHDEINSEAMACLLIPELASDNSFAHFREEREIDLLKAVSELLSSLDSTAMQ